MSFRTGSSRFEDSRVVGLRNAAGEQNCFLNVVIQAMWRLRASREFLLNSKPSSRNKFVVLDALANLFNDYRMTREKILPPVEVRQTLAAIFAHLNRFQIGQMDDAGESLYCMLASLHGSADIDKPCEDINACLGHAIFSLDAMNEHYCEQCVWHESLPKETSFSYPVYAQELLDAKSTESYTSKVALDEMIKYVKLRRGMECQKCHEKNAVFLRTFVIGLPQVLYINMIWPSIDVDKSNLRAILEMIEPCEHTFRTRSAFDFIEKYTEIPNYTLSGMICFYPGQHYVYIGKIDGDWAIFDDHQVRHIGNFHDVMDKCILAKYVPVSLFFERSADHPNAADDDDDGSLNEATTQVRNGAISHPRDAIFGSSSSSNQARATSLLPPYQQDGCHFDRGTDEKNRQIRERRSRTPSPTRIQSSPIATTTSSTALDASRAVPKRASSVGYGTTRRREDAKPNNEQGALSYVEYDYDDQNDRFIDVLILEDFASGIPRRF